MKLETLLLASGAMIGAAVVGTAGAVEGAYPFQPLGCDNPPPIVLTHELGTAPAFPLDELIEVVSWVTTMTACPATMQGNGPANVMIQMTNRTATTWTDLYFVADPNYSITNFDGTINGGKAFRIDKVGSNTPLVFEVDGMQNGTFEPGETWAFIVQNWLPQPGSGDWQPPSFGSIGVGALSLPGMPGDPAGQTSSASILAVPEPGAWAMFCAGLGALGVLGRRGLRCRR